MQTTTVSQMPELTQKVMNNDLGVVSGMALDDASRQKVFRLCALLGSANDAGWVKLVAGWGFDLNAAPVQSPADAGLTSRNWLWNALAKGKLAQAAELVRHGFTAIDVDDQGRSGLGVLIEQVYHDHLPALLEMLAGFEACSLAWQSWPDALAFNDRLRKNVGSSLDDLMSDRARRCLMQDTILVDLQDTPARL